MAMYIRLKHVNTAPKGSIENIEIEKYIQGVVAAELGGSQPIEALKAQSVAARTYAIYHTNNNRNYDVDDTTTYQAYNPQRVNDNIKKAVNDTAGLVLTYNGNIALAAYSGSNGGKVYSARQVWGGTNYPYLAEKADPYTDRSGYTKYGHGVGMSQRGAIQAAKEGLTYNRILSFYYPSTSLVGNYNSGGNNQYAPISLTSDIANLGSKIVEEARKHIGKPVVIGESGPQRFSDYGFVWYVYREAIDYNWTLMNSKNMYLSDRSRVVTGTLKEGDLVFFVDRSQVGSEPPVSHVGIATGVGLEFIHGSLAEKKIVVSDLGDDFYSTTYYATKRILEDTETTGSSEYYSEVVSMSPAEVQQYIQGMLSNPITQRFNDLEEQLGSTISDMNQRVVGPKRHGYLVDMTNGGDFKFIVPEYNSTIQANWDTQTILGRSSDIVGYNHTSSESIELSMDLLAGTGLYITGNDVVADLHKDLDFVSSLEYPDYSKALSLPPPIVYLYLNETKHFRGVVTNVSINYGAPYDEKNRPMFAHLSFTVLRIDSDPQSYLDVRNRLITNK